MTNMSFTKSTDKEVAKLIDNFFLKCSLLICSTKSNKLQTPVGEVPHLDEEWFFKRTEEELELPEIVRQWSKFDVEKELPPLVIETYLDLRNLGPFDSIHLKDEEGNSWSVCRGTKKSEIVLERWLIELDSLSAAFKSHKVSEEETKNSLRQFLLLFRYLYTLTQLLPANDLYLSLSKNAVSQNTLPLLRVCTRILDGSKPILSKGRIGLSKPIISTYSNVINESNVPSHLEQRKITPVWTKYGLLRVSVSYRRDCQFEVHHHENNEDEINNITTFTARRLSQNQQQQQSLSLSPYHGHAGSLNSMEQHSLSKKPLSITRQLQPFKVGSVGSTPIPQPHHTLTRNPSSSSSILANLQAQRSSNSSTWGPTAQQITPHGDPHIESTSAGSTSKYSSSFDRLRRHSSAKYNDVTTEKPLSKPVKISPDSQPNEDLLDFVKMINDRPELNIRRSPRDSMDISNSLMKFQNLKPTNDMIGENLNLSLSMDANHALQSHSHRSNSHSPLPSFSPSLHYPLVQSKFSRSRSLSHDRESITGTVTRRSSGDGPSNAISVNHVHNNSGISSSLRPNVVEKVTAASSFTPCPDSHYGNFHRSTQRREDIGEEREKEEEDDDDEALLMNRSGSSATRIRSMDSISTSISKNRLPMPQPSNYSQPTTTAIPAYAKLHRPGARSAERQRDESSRKLENYAALTRNAAAADDNGSPHGEEDDDEDLLFFMSDMNLTKM